MKKNCGYIHIYTGNGKGKTSAAIGLCIRAYRILIRFFLWEDIGEGLKI